MSVCRGLERVPGAALCKNIQIKCVEFYPVVSVRRSSTIDLGYLEVVESAYLAVMGPYGPMMQCGDGVTAI